MGKYARRRFLRKCAIAVFLLSVSAVVVARQRGWLTLKFELATTGSAVTADGAASDAHPTASAAVDTDPFRTERDTHGTREQIDPIVFDAQSEPTSNDQPAFGRGETQATLAQSSQASRRNDPPFPASSPALSFLPADARTASRHPVQATGAVETDATVTHAANEVEQMADLSNVARADEAPTSDPAETPGTPVSERPIDLEAIDQLIQSGDDINALRSLSSVYWHQPDMRPMIQKRLDATAQRIYFSPRPHYLPPYVVQPGDQLRNIAKRYDVSWEYLARLNQVDPRRIQANQKLKVIKGPFSVLVDLSDFELTVHSNGYFVRKYRVGTGKDSSSPVGTFVVLNKVVNPQYTDPDGHVIESDDPSNPLGEYWLDIGDGFGIHGTIEPDSIGRDVSRGCIRMLNDDVAEVFNLLIAGSEVVIRR